MLSKCIRYIGSHKRLTVAILSIGIVFVSVAYSQFGNMDQSKHTKNASGHHLATVPLTAPVGNTLFDTGDIQSSKPQTLHFFKGIADAEFEPVGVDDSGNMQAPKNVMNVSWLDLGIVPGQKGTVVVAGHYDKKDLSPAIFYKLNELRIGDTFEVAYANGAKRTFEVFETEDAAVSPELAAKVFENQTNESRVYLITCSGDWDRDQKSYSHRFVVYARLKSM